MNEYTIQTISGPMTVLLSDEDAEARGLTKPTKAPKKESAPVEEKAAKPENKSRTAANKKRAELAEQAFTK